MRLPVDLPTIIAITPFEKPDAALARKLTRTPALAVLHVGNDDTETETAIQRLVGVPEGIQFGLCCGSKGISVAIPQQVTWLIAPWGTPLPASYTGERLYQVTSLREAQQAWEAGYHRIIAKGNESGGEVGTESAFILVQRILQALPALKIWVQGGVGVHTAAGLIAMGAEGVVLDSQLALFPECAAPAELKRQLAKVSGNDTSVVDGRRVLARPSSTAVASDGKMPLVIGQDIAFSGPAVARFGSVATYIHALVDGIAAHVRQAKSLDILGPKGAMAEALGTEYAIAQGPMTRVSDVPEFAAAVAQAGALPFVALSLMKGESAQTLIAQTKRLAAGNAWGVGILGFAPQELREEQLAYIEAERPPFVLIAGGRPSQSAALEKQGIHTFLHVPAPALLDLFLKEGADKFVFEGRECGGHVGPLSSLVLWELQINRLLEEERADRLHVFFAGGIHDARSAVFVSVMAAPLAARGAKIGVLMGTAYLYTEEATGTGAILPEFQRQAIQHTETVLLETAPGHETRCLGSPFTVFFEQEKQRMADQAVDKKERWSQLETLNVGRLRIASKGIERQGDSLKPVSTEEQAQKGMYMIGQVAALRHGTLTVSQLHRQVALDSAQQIAQLAVPATAEATDRALDIAIVGMACIYPGASTVEQFWTHILTAKDCVTEVPDERWNKDIYYDPETPDGSKSPSKWGGFIPDIPFDPLAFGIPPQSLAAIDPAQLLSLLVARQALADAGYDNEAFNGENVSVIIGAEGGHDLANSYGFRAFFPQVFGTLSPELEQALPRLTEDSFPGVLANVIAGRITNRLNLGGRNFTVDAACASSLAAVELACQELVLGKSDMVLAGAADLHNSINDYLLFASTHALSRKGRCATFDSAADGIALGEGVAMLVLKRQADAQADGDRIYAVIKGIGGSSDGKSLGLTAPNKQGQRRALARAYQQAGFSPATVGMVEAHGTGTVVGDRTELSALTDMWYAAGATSKSTVLGSVKTQIGHTKCAAGLAGVIKAALSVYHGVKPPTLHLQAPNTFYQERFSPFSFHREAAPWLQNHRKAGVSAFGFGGTNFHMILAQANPVRNSETVMQVWPAELCVFRGDSREEALQRIRQTKHFLTVNDASRLRDIAYSLAGRSDQPIQVSVVASSVADLFDKLDLIVQGKPHPDIYDTQLVEGKVALLFSGQGSQRIGMARQLFLAFPQLRRWLERYPAYAEVLFPPAAFDEQQVSLQRAQMKDTRFAQPLLGVVDYGIAQLWRRLGLLPDMVAGHSYGELPALCFAGAFDESQLIPLSEQRAAAILDGVGDDKGMMLAVQARREAFEAMANETMGVYAVNHNSPEQWVLAGGTEAILTAAGRLKAAGIPCKPLEVACAFHSPLIAASESAFRTTLQDVPFDTPGIPVWSNTTAKPYPQAPDEIKNRLAEHLVKPVRFADELADLYAAGARVFIESGPGKVLSDLCRTTLGADVKTIHSEDRSRDGITQLLSAVAQFLATGRTLNLHVLFEDRKAQVLVLEAPDKYRLGASTWLVNGQWARPMEGALPSHGAKPITKPLGGLPAVGPANAVAADSSQQLVANYLENMRQLAVAQRDVVLGLLGNPLPMQPPEQGLPTAAPSAASGSPTRPTRLASATSQATQPAASAPSAKEVLLRVVSDKTGYPVDMLGLDLDLEADLSIDSIKRMEIIGELRIQLGGFGSDTGGTENEHVVEELAGLKNLNALLDWIARHHTDATDGVPSPKPVPSTLSQTQIQHLLLSVVSDKTGYPTEMLDLDLDLEADLSIDSIKRMEIMGEVRLRIGLKERTDEMAEDRLMEQMAGIKSLNGLVQWLANAMEGGRETLAEAKRILDSPADEQPDGTMVRLVTQAEQATLPAVSEVRDQRRRVAVFGPEQDAACLQQVLIDTYGWVADVITTLPTSKLTYDGLIIHHTADSESVPSFASVLECIQLVDRTALSFLFIVTPPSTESSLLPGYPGLLKSLAHEWTPVNTRHIVVDPDTPTDQLGAWIADEAAHPGGDREVRYRQGMRELWRHRPVTLDRSTSSAIPLTQSDVVLVLGGAQGITAELVLRLAASAPCHYILVGRTPLTPVAPMFSGMLDVETIKQALIAQGEISQPAVINREASAIAKANQLQRAVSALTATGATVTYECLDLRNGEALGTLITEIYATRGRIDGVIHGAGILEDKLFHQKPLDSFLRVYETKVTPLKVLHQTLRFESLRFLVLFSSVASAFGNRGQTDYAAANSVFDTYARTHNGRSGCKVLAINWGPWKGAGMVDASLEREYLRRGIPLIPLDEGADWFVRELLHGPGGQVVIIAGSKSAVLLENS